MKDAREKFDTVTDCEPSIERLHKGVQEMEEQHNTTKKTSKVLTGRNVYTEQDVYAACDSMEILRDAYLNKEEHKTRKTTTTTLGGLERCHKLGLDAMA